MRMAWSAAVAFQVGEQAAANLRPAERVESVPRRPNSIPGGAILRLLLATGAPRLGRLGADICGGSQ